MMHYRLPHQHLVVTLLLTAALCTPVMAQRGLPKSRIPKPDPAAQIKTLQVAEGFEINLFAADPMIAKPIQMNWDAQGRLWVASSSVYPQIKPGQKANDKIVILVDTTGDGKADKRTVFADGLLIPTTVIPGDGGAYIGASTELLHMKDTDGDGRADQQRVVLSGFGTEDTHHILHTLRWGPEGLLYFNQSIYIHSHLETPWGVRRLGGSGTWQLDPRSMKLAIVMRGLVNPWGRHWNRWGTAFATDGAGGDGINFTFPGATFMTAEGAKAVLRGLNPGQPKDCGLEVLSGRHIPEAWRGRLITNDFRGHRTCSFSITPSGSGYVTRRVEDLIKSSHLAFRPIDIKMGPDGAIYIADWYNPIIQHGEVDFRDSRRDHAHGRIWRITAKGRPLVKPPKLVGASVAELLNALKLPEQLSRTHAKRLLAERGAKAVAPELAKWVAALDPKDPEFEHLRLEALWTYQAIDQVNAPLLRAVCESPDDRARAAGVRVVSHWNDRIVGGMSLLAAAVADEHPRVRLEAVCSLNTVGTPEAHQMCLVVLNKPIDKFIDHALRIALLGERGRQQLTSGPQNYAHLLFLLEHLNNARAIDPLLKLIEADQLPAAARDRVYSAVSRLGTQKHLSYVFEKIVAAAPKNPANHARLLSLLETSAAQRKLIPTGDTQRISKLLSSESAAVREAAARLAGTWKVESQRAALSKIALAADQSLRLRSAAIAGLAGLGTPASTKTLESLTDAKQPAKVQIQSVIALAVMNQATAASHAARVLGQLSPEADPRLLCEAFLTSKQGPDALAKAVSDKSIKADVARLAIRTVQSSAQPHAQLVASLQKAGGLGAQAKPLTPDELAKLIAEVNTKGDPARGEAVYRRHNMACIKCHAIAGAGGRVGPDLVSIGASAPVDYLIDSILEPNKKIKENYHSLVVVTKSGQVWTGVKVGQSQKDLLLRDAEGRDLRIPLADIDEQANGGSLMPRGLTAGLTRAELVDLVRFLSSLGKIGPYSVGNRRWIRHWQAVDSAGAKIGSAADIAKQPESVTWRSAYSQVSGNLPPADLPKLNLSGKVPGSIVRFGLNVATAGQIKLRLNDTAGLTLWLDGKPMKAADSLGLDLTKGQHTVTIAIDRNGRKEPLQIELLDIPGSAAQVRQVSNP
jgi:putative heme-binding domain-containing protein